MKLLNPKIFYLFVFFVGFSCNELSSSKEKNLGMMETQGTNPFSQEDNINSACFDLNEIIIKDFDEFKKNLALQ